MGIAVGYGRQVGDASVSIDEYAQKISEEIVKERNRARERAEQEANQLVAEAHKESAVIIARAQSEAEQIVTTAKKQVKEEASEESDRILAEARQNAQRITEKARAEVEKESARYMAELRQKAEQSAAALEEEARERAEAESAAIVARAFEEAERIIKEADDWVQKEAMTGAQQQTEHIIAEARAESERIVAEARQKAESIANEVRGRVQRELEESTRFFTEAKQMLENGVTLAEDKTEREPRGVNIVAQPRAAEKTIEVAEPVLEMETSGAKLYQGTVELDIVSQGDFGQIGRMREHLRKVPNLEVVALGSCVNGRVAVFLTVAEPLPLTDILREVPLVKSVVEQGNKIEVALTEK